VFYDKVTKYITDNINSKNSGKTEYFYNFPLQNTGNYTGSTYYKLINPTTFSGSPTGVYEVLPANPVTLGDVPKYSLHDDADLTLVVDYKYTGIGQDPYMPVRSLSYNYVPVTLKSLHTFMVTLSGDSRDEHALKPYTSVDHIERELLMNYRFYTYYHDLKVDKLISVTETTYPDPESGLGIETTTTNAYVSDTSFRVKKTTMQDSKGEKTITKTYYPDDVTDNTSLGNDPLSSLERTAIDRLKADDLHRIGEPVQVETYRDKDGNGTAEVSELMSV
jgi:hypothetical protein